jgi:hypothetical protein
MFPFCRVCDKPACRLARLPRSSKNSALVLANIGQLKRTTLSMTTYIKTTQDGRKVEVIGMAVCLDGKQEADHLVAVVQHPNWRAILAAAPDATHMAGRLPLTVDEAEKAQLAMNAAKEAYDSSPTGVAERSRLAINGMLMKRGDE